MPEHIYSDQWPERWNQSKEIWERRKEEAKQGKFPSEDEILASHGYCFEHGAGKNLGPTCIRCSLFKKEDCSSLKMDSEGSTFWKIYTELRLKKTPTREAIIPLMEKILNSIEEDSPI